MIEGNFTGKATRCELGTNKRGQPELRMEFSIEDGEHKGKRVPYSGLFTAKGIKYTKHAMLALGWAGKDVATAPADIMSAGKTVPIEVTIAEWENNGKVSRWSTVRSVGRLVEPLKPIDKSTTNDINAWLAKEGTSEASDEDIPF
jgi:hypothetical protein